MKYPAGPAQPRRKAARRQVRLDLRRSTPPPSPGDELERQQRSSFWKWFCFVVLFHLIALAIVMWVYRAGSPPPPPTFISLLPEGDTVKGTPGEQAAPKVGPSTPAPSSRPETPPAPVTPPAPAPAAVQPPPPDATQPKIIQPQAPTLVAKSKPKPPKPVKPKIKVDLHLVDGPTPDVTTPAKLHKHVKKPTVTPTEHHDETDRDAASADNMGLSKEQIAARLGEKLDEAGVSHSNVVGASGAADGHKNDFSDFYASIHDQVMNKWQEPNLDDSSAANPVVQIHVEKDGRVPPEQVTLLRGSGNQAIDDSALGAARSLGYLLQPLPDGCPPDISITFKLTR